MNLSGFGSLFPFRNNISMSSPVSLLLDDENVTLQQLLDEESFINEFKIQSAKLVQFMKYDKYKQLIEYVTKVGPEDDQKKGYKFPFVACEVLTADTNAPSDFMLPEKELTVEEDHLETIDVETEVEDDEESPLKPEKEASPQKAEEMPALQKPAEAEAQPQLNDEKAPEQGDTIKQSMQKEAEEGVQTKTSPQKESPVEPASEETAETKQESSEQQHDSIDETEVPKTKPRKTKKVIVKKEVITKVKKEVPGLVGSLFEYIEGEMNYTLAGYFARIFNVLFAKKGPQLTTYFFTNENYLKILNHIESRSIAEIIVKMLTIDSKQYLKERQNLILQVLSRLSTETTTEAMVNLSFIVCDTIEKYSTGIKSIQGSNEMLTYIYGTEFCTLLVNNVMNDNDQVSIYNAPILLNSLVSIRSLLQNKETAKINELAEKYDEFMNFLKTHLAESAHLNALFKELFSKGVAKLNLKKSQSPTLGMGRVRLLEVLFFLIKFDFFNIQSIVQEHPFFATLFSLMQEYELNNVLHNEVVKIVTFVLEQQAGSPLITDLLDHGKLLEFLLHEAIVDEQMRHEIAENQKGAHRKGYIGHVVKIGQLLNKLSETNTQIKNSYKDQKWNKVKELISRETFQAEKTLAGYSTRRGETPNNVMFHKEDILALYQTFLSQPPVTVYPPPEPEPFSDPEIEAPTTPEPEQLTIVEAEATTMPIQEEGAVEKADQIYSSVSYWKPPTNSHSLEDLMNQL